MVPMRGRNLPLCRKPIGVSGSTRSGPPLARSHSRSVGATAQALLNNADSAARRIERGIELLRDDAQVLLAFRVANRAMADAAHQRRRNLQPNWFPFQLAFILMNLEGIANPESADRSKVDLLFFPTGGGKTEAYLGLAAFTLILRRLRNPGITGAGTSVLMRYTLRLLTLDQLGRAATLILRDGTDPANR